MRLLPALLLLTILAACGGQYSLVKTDRQVIGQAYSVEPQLEWSRQSVRFPVDPKWQETGETTRAFHFYEIWTVDGFRLQSLFLFEGVPDGDPLFPRTDIPQERLPVFRGTMQAGEVSQFVVASLSQLGNNAIEARNLRPASFGTLPGFRFELAYFSQTGLKFDGMAVGTVNRGILHLILFTGARSYHFPKYRDAVERLFDSIEFIGKTAGLPGRRHASREVSRRASLRDQLALAAQNPSGRSLALATKRRWAPVNGRISCLQASGRTNLQRGSHRPSSP